MDASNPVTILVAAGVISTILGIVSCSTNGHIADMNAHLDSRIHNLSTHLDSRTDDVNARIDDVRADIRELRGLIIDAVQAGPAAD